MRVGANAGSREQQQQSINGPTHLAAGKPIVTSTKFLSYESFEKGTVIVRT